MIAQADAVRIPLPSKSVHCVVSSPPYWGLRKYSGDQGDEPLGLESTPERHVERIVEICREVRRVLRDDGVFWLNYGDCYASSNAKRPNESDVDKEWARERAASGGNSQGRYPSRRSGQDRAVMDIDIRQGSLMMMPHRVALALQADDWIVRQDLVWSKSNPMPESVNGWRWQRERTKTGELRPRDGTGWDKGSGRTDGYTGGHIADNQWNEYEYGDDLELKRGSWRHTRAHEYVFMLTKKMQYWSNQEAVREKGSGRTPGNITYKYDGLPGHETKQGILAQSNIPQVARNPRSVLDVPTAPYRGAHYATFPPNLIAPLIRATCPRWACPVCGQGWAAVVNTSYGKSPAHGDGSQIGKAGTPHGMTGMPRVQRRDNTLGYRPTCSHEHTQEEAVPGICFDPFVGSGTTIAVAKSLLRRGIGIDISMEYLDEQAKVRAGLGTPSKALEDLPLFR